MKPKHTNLFSILGLHSTPWSVRIYLLLVLLFTALVVITLLPGAPAGLWTLASDGLKTVLGALLGALSIIREQQLRQTRLEAVRQCDEAR